MTYSEALEAAFPCAGCAKFVAPDWHAGGNQKGHLALCPVNYRSRAMDFARLLGVLD